MVWLGNGNRAAEKSANQEAQRRLAITATVRGDRLRVIAYEDSPFLLIHILMPDMAVGIVRAECR
jgi:hypothetical protein